MESNTKQITSLPECWHIKVTDENAKILSEWRNSGRLNSSHIVGICKFYNGTLRKEHNPKDIIFELGRNGYTFGKEITFEQFKKWVLNKNKNYELW